MHNTIVIKFRYLLLTGLVAVTLAFEDGRFSDALRLHDQLTSKRSKLSTVKSVLSDLDNDLANVQSKVCILSHSTDDACSGFPSKRSDADAAAADLFSPADGDRKKWSDACSVGGGIPSYACRMEQLNGGGTGAWDSDDKNPGKRSPEAKSFGEILKDLAKKRAALGFIKRIIEETSVKNEQTIKRNCLVNLGGHCATETAAAMADMYHYLNSAESPGRKKREAGSNLLRKALRRK